MLSGKLTGRFAPDYVIPFQIDRDKAKEIFAGWIAKKKYVPDAFYSGRQIETMTGVYFPYWLTDAGWTGCWTPGEKTQDMDHRQYALHGNTGV